MSAGYRSSPANPSVVSFADWKRRHRAAARCEPLESGRRDPAGRPAFDPDGRAYRAAREHLAVVLADETTPAAVRASLAVVLERRAEGAA